MIQIEIDNGSGFCFGVTTAISKAEEELAKGGSLYCLGDIVHNGMECERLRDMGLITINHDDMLQLHDVKVLLRAHGEPPETYELAHRNNIDIIDATCPVVLALQRRIHRQYAANPEAQIVIFGKNGHAEVLGLVGQTHSHATVIEKLEDAKKLDMGRDIYLYSQTTKSLDEFHRIIAYIQEHISSNATFKSFDTICRQVANRMPHISSFASRHEPGFLLWNGHVAVVQFDGIVRFAQWRHLAVTVYIVTFLYIFQYLVVVCRYTLGFQFVKASLGTHFS